MHETPSLHSTKWGSRTTPTPAKAVLAHSVTLLGGQILNQGLGALRRIAGGNRAADGCGLRHEPLEQGDLRIIRRGIGAIDSIIYLVGFIVIVMFILSLLGALGKGGKGDRGWSPVASRVTTAGLSTAGLSCLEWSAVLAGAVLAAALSFVLITFGAAIGLSVASPWPNSELPTKPVASLGVFWTMAQQMGAIMVGGHVAGHALALARNRSRSRVPQWATSFGPSAF